jgi:hypothetical protein
LRAEKIKDIYIIHGTGTPIYHRAYVTSKVDDNLLSGFLTAIFALSEEISTNRIQVMDMQDTKFMYEQTSPYIFILNVQKDINIQFGKEILTKTIEAFKNDIAPLSLDIKSDTNLLGEHLDCSGFDGKLDRIVNEEILEHYFNDPSQILDEIEQFLMGLFGSLGTDILNASAKEVCKMKSQFKKEHLGDLIESIEVAISRRTGKDQAKMITKQIKDTFV